MKRLAVWVATLALTALMFGCGGETNDNKANTNSSSTNVNRNTNTNAAR